MGTELGSNQPADNRLAKLRSGSEARRLSPEVLLGFVRHLRAERIACSMVEDPTSFDATTADARPELIVSEAALPGVPRQALNYCKCAGIHLVNATCGRRETWRLAFSQVDSNGSLAALQFEVSGSCLCGDRCYLSASEMLEAQLDATAGKELPVCTGVLNPAHAFLHSLLRIIDRGSMDSKEVACLMRRWNLDPKGSADAVDRVLTSRDAELVAGMAERNDWSELPNHLSRLRRGLRNGRRVELVGSLRKSTARFRAFCRPPGLMVAVLGPDGSGKSTLIGRLPPIFELCGHGVERAHLRPTLGRKSGNANPPTTDPHGQVPRSWLSSCVKLCFLLVVYQVGYWTQLRPLLVKSTCVVFDRYYHDLLVDPKRYRLAGAGPLAHLIGLLVPKPDYWLLLDAPAEVVQQRKSEVSYEESRRQRDAYRVLVSSFASSAILDAAKPEDDVAKQATIALVGFLANRTEYALR